MASPTVRSPRVGVAPAYQRTSRKSRRPQHRFNLKTKPFQLQPFMIAPVLPSESLKNMMLQSQVWSDPLAVGPMKNVGWWCEYFFAYVKHRDLLGYEIATDGLGKDLIDMFVTNEALTGHVDADGNTWTYCPPGGVDFLQEAMKRVIEEYFRDEGEAWNVATLDGVPLARIYGKGSSDWSEKLTLAADYEDRRVSLDVDGDDDITVDELDRAFTEWAAARDAGLMDMDYEDWMRTYGSGAITAAPDRVDLHRPEMLAHVREFTYPTNTVEPTTGVPASAVGWRVASRLNKSFFFPEPGWIIGFNCVRPKVYLGNQEGSIASMMQTRNSWLPAILNDQMNVSHLLIPETTGPLGGVITDAGGYWIDLRDLLNYGDQFVNYAISATPPPPFVELPLATGQRRYAAEAEIEAFFATPASGVFNQDGVVSLSILGRQVERTKNLVLGQS